MVDPATPADELVSLVDVLKLALAVHVTAEAKILDTLLSVVSGPSALRLIAEQTREEHATQHRLIDLLSTRPGGEPWLARVLELRVHVLDHASRADLARWTFQDHVPRALARELAREYATERMCVLARTSPIAIARAKLDLNAPAARIQRMP